MSYEIGAKVVLEGEKEYSQAISKLNRITRENQAVTKALSEEYKNSSKTTGSARALLDQYTGSIAEQERKIKTLAAGIDMANSKYGANSARVQEITIDYYKEQAALSKLQSEYKKLSEVTDATTRSQKANTTEYKDVMERFDSVLAQNKSSLELLNSTFEKGSITASQAKEQHISLSRVYDTQKQKIDFMSVHLEELTRVYGVNSREVANHVIALNKEKVELNNLGQKIDETGNKTLGFADIVKASAFGQLIADQVKKAISAFKEFTDSSIDLAASVETLDYRIGNIFGASGASQIEKWAQYAEGAFGTAEVTTKDFTARLGQLGKTAGMSSGKLTQFSTDLSIVAGRLSGISGIEPDKVFSDIQNALSGSKNALIDYGISLERLDKNMSESEKMWEVYQQIMRKSPEIFKTNAQGAESYTQKLYELREKAKMVKIAFGEELLPSLTESFGKLSDYIIENEHVLSNLGNMLGGIINGFTMLLQVVTSVPAQFWAVIASVVAGIKIFTELKKQQDKISQATSALASVLDITLGKSFDSTLIKIVAIVGAVSVLLFLILALKEGSEKAAHSMNQSFASANKEADRMKNLSKNPPKSLGGYEKGTVSARKGLALVGEKGPELIDFGHGGARVYNAAKTSQMAMAGVQNTSTVNNVTIEVNGIQEFSDLMHAINTSRLTDRMNGGGGVRGELYNALAGR